jgi:hypothetical protein
MRRGPDRFEPSKAHIIPIGVAIATAFQIHVPAHTNVPVK